jgi:hypothetical protein
VAVDLTIDCINLKMFLSKVSPRDANGRTIMHSFESPLLNEIPSLVLISRDQLIVLLEFQMLFALQMSFNGKSSGHEVGDRTYYRWLVIVIFSLMQKL